ncbi:hypothetical protein Hanom_Chr09g00826391 [Helianthus anomalus]
MFWFCCQFAPCREQNGKTNNLDGVRGGEQTGKKTEHQGVKRLFLKVWSKTVKVIKPQEQNGSLLSILFWQPSHSRKKEVYKNWRRPYYTKSTRYSLVKGEKLVRYLLICIATC